MFLVTIWSTGSGRKSPFVCDLQDMQDSRKNLPSSYTLYICLICGKYSMCYVAGCRIHGSWPIALSRHFNFSRPNHNTKQNTVAHAHGDARPRLVLCICRGACSRYIIYLHRYGEVCDYANQLRHRHCFRRSERELMGSGSLAAWYRSEAS